jgi:hypothetical protein
MRFKNTKTGAVVDSSFYISGGDWVPFDLTLSKQAEVTSEPTTEEPLKIQENPKEPVDLTGDEAYDGITKKQIIQELDAFGIEYNPKANKPELYALMMAQGE